MLPKIDLSKVTLTEMDQLKDLSIATFIESFSAQNTAENMNKYINEVFSTKQLSLEISNPNSVFYFALNGDRPIGYLKLNFRQVKVKRIMILHLK